MNSTIWLALALVLVLEGLGPMLYPKAWKKMISAMVICPIIFYVVLAVDLWLRALWSTTC